jgi:hypothetical protein
LARRGRIIIHAGIHKTGTTSLQVALWRMRLQLKERRIRYPQLQLPGQVRAHHALAKGLAADHPERDPMIADFFGRCRDFGGTMIVSSEAFSLLPAESVNRVVKVLRDLFDDVTAVLYFRPQALILRSQYSQQLREGYLSCSFEEFFQKAKKGARFWHFRDLCERWESAVGEDHFHARSALRGDLIGNDITRDFLAAFLDIKDVEVPTVVRNDSLSLERANVIRRILLDTDAGSIPFEMRRILLRDFIKQFDWGGLGKENEIPITPEMMNYCRQQFRDENAYLSRWFGGNDIFGAWYGTAVQSAKAGAEREPPSSETMAEVAKIACNAWKDFVDQAKVNHGVTP